MTKVFKYLPAIILVLLPTLLSAQSTENYGNQLLQQTNSALVGIVSNVVTLLRTVIGLGALVFLVMVVYNILHSDREAAEKLAWWLAGFTLGFVLLSVVAGFIK